MKIYTCQMFNVTFNSNTGSYVSLLASYQVTCVIIFVDINYTFNTINQTFSTLSVYLYMQFTLTM